MVEEDYRQPHPGEEGRMDLVTSQGALGSAKPETAVSPSPSIYGWVGSRLTRWWIRRGLYGECPLPEAGLGLGGPDGSARSSRTKVAVLRQ